MVRKNCSRHIRGGDYFYQYTRKLKKDIGGNISDRELTDGIARFLESESLTPIIKRRATKRRWWL